MFFNWEDIYFDGKSCLYRVDQDMRLGKHYGFSSYLHNLLNNVSQQCYECMTRYLAEQSHNNYMEILNSYKLLSPIEWMQWVERPERSSVKK